MCCSRFCCFCCNCFVVAASVFAAAFVFASVVAALFLLLLLLLLFLLLLLLLLLFLLLLLLLLLLLVFVVIYAVLSAAAFAIPFFIDTLMIVLTATFGNFQEFVIIAFFLQMPINLFGKFVLQLVSRQFLTARIVVTLLFYFSFHLTFFIVV